jgi:hypothetical protein
VRWIVTSLIAVTIAGGALYLGFALLAGTTTGACPTALLQGELVEQDGTLAVRSIPGGGVSKVQWPFGYGVGEADGTLTLTRVLITVAREGDLVSMAGGALSDDSLFVACGPVAIGLAIPPESVTPDPRAKLTLTGTAYEPCIPPPSGCGYRVSLTSPSAGTSRAELRHHRSYENAERGEPTPLTLGDGLPTWVQPGEYDLVFEVEASSDAATPEPLDDGSLGYRPVITVACSWHLVVPAGANAVIVEVIFHGSACTVAERAGT